MESDGKTESSTQPAPAEAPAGFIEFLRPWRYFFALLALILAVAGFYAEENWRGEFCWNRFLRQSQKSGKRVEPSQVIPPMVPDRENFAMTPLFTPTAPSTSSIGQGRRKFAADRAVAFSTRYNDAERHLKNPKELRTNSWVRSRTSLPLWYAAFQAASNATPERIESSATNVSVAAAAEGVLAAMADCEDAFDELREASKRPYARFNLNYNQENPAAIMLPHLSLVRRIELMLQLHAEASLALGRTDQAFEDLQLMLAVVNVLKSEPILVSQLVRIASFHLCLKVFAEGERQWSDSQLASLQRDFQQFDFCSDVHRAFRAEGVLLGEPIIDLVRRSADRSQVMSYMSGSGPGPMLGFLFKIAPSGWFYFEKTEFARWSQEQVMALIDPRGHRVDPALVRVATTNLSRLAGHSPARLFLSHRYFCSLLLPFLGGATEKTAFAQTAADLASLVCALERYKIKHHDFPDTLAGLCPEFIREVPHDVVTGLPLKYRHLSAERYELYSVGWDEKDDDGLAVGITERQEIPKQPGPGGDWVWRPIAADWR